MIADQLESIKMIASNMVKVQFVYGQIDGGTRHTLKLCFRITPGEKRLDSLNVKDFVDISEKCFIAPFLEFQSWDIKWYSVSIIYPSLKNQNLMNLPLRQIRGTSESPVGYQASLNVSLRFRGVRRASKLEIHGISESALSKLNSPTESETPENPLRVCESIFIGSSIFSVKNDSDSTDKSSNIPENRIRLTYVYEKTQIIEPKVATKTLKSKKKKKKDIKLKKKKPHFLLKTYTCTN